MSKNKQELINQLEKEINRIKIEIVMGGYNGHMMTEDYKQKLIKLKEQLKELKK